MTSFHTPVRRARAPGGKSGVSPRAAQRRAVLEAALRLLSEEGPSALRVRRIAERAGYSTMGVYTSFGGKDGVLDAVYLAGFERFAAELASVAPTDDPLADLRAAAFAYRRFALAEPALYAIMFERAAPDFVPTRAARAVARQTFDFLVGLVERCIEVGGLTARGAMDAAYVVFCTLHGLVSIELTHRAWGGPILEHLADAPEASEAAYRAGIDTVIAGLR